MRSARRIPSVLLALIAALVWPATTGCSGGDGGTPEGRTDNGAGHESTTSPSSTTGAPAEPVAPEAYLHELERIVRSHAYYANRIDWGWWERESTEVARRATTTADTYQLVDDLLIELGDRHSFLVSPSEATELGGEPDQLTRAETPSVEVSGSIGAIELPGTGVTPDTRAGRTYVSTVRRALADDACGWIIDLRTNVGGSLPTMLAAVAPLLGPGPSVAYRRRDGSTDTMAITEDGALQIGDHTIPVHVERPAFRHRTDPVAVLHGPATVSAGEGVVMAFRGRPDARSFGRPTHGAPSGRERFDLPDGSALLLTTAIGVDRTGVQHHDPIPPDVELRSQDTVRAARAWLQAHPNCR